MNTVVIIPARAGSKRLKGKNRRKLKKKPLINWTIDFARKLSFVDDIILTTNDRIIMKIVKKYNIKVLKRSSKLSKDKTKTIDVIFDVLKKYEKKNYKIQNIILLQITSPFRSKKIIEQAYKRYIKNKKKKSIISVNNTKDTNLNGNFYIASKKFLNKNKSFISKKNTIPIKLYSNRLKIDIDTKKDFQFAKSLIN